MDRKNATGWINVVHPVRLQATNVHHSQTAGAACTLNALEPTAAARVMVHCSFVCTLLEFAFAEAGSF